MKQNGAAQPLRFVVSFVFGMCKSYFTKCKKYNTILCMYKVLHG